ncbi:MAG TPA: beta-propeller fold lactonase family protein [Polyangiaceae bacterium]|nr:beta-propeller fold lactonase family protein [Polyangiaceae bacterium]
MGRHLGTIVVFSVSATLASCDSSTDEPSYAPGATGGGGGLSTGGDGSSTGGHGSGTGGVTASGGRGGGSGGTAGGPDVDGGSAGRDGGNVGTGGTPVDASSDGNGGPEAGIGGAPGTGGSSGTGGARPDAGEDAEPDGGPRLREFGYVAARFGGLFTCSIDPTSGMATQIGSSFNLPRSEPVAIAVHPSQKFVYVAYLDFQDGENFIDAYRIAADGTLDVSGRLTVSTPESVESIAVEPQGHFAYAVSGAEKAIYPFRIDADTGALTSLGNPLPVGSAQDPATPTFVAADPTGRFVYVSLAFGNVVFGYRIDRNGATPGSLVEIASSPFGIPGLPDGSSTFGGAIALTPDGHFLYTSGGGRLNGYAIDDAGGTGALTSIGGSPFSLVVESDAPAPNLVVDPSGKHVYATQFHSGSAIHGFDIDAGGALSKLSEPLTVAAPYSVAIEPSGHFLYVPNDANTVTRFAIAPSGALTELGQSQFGGLEAKMVFATLP